MHNKMNEIPVVIIGSIKKDYGTIPNITTQEIINNTYTYIINNTIHERTIINSYNVLGSNYFPVLLFMLCVIGIISFMFINARHGGKSWTR